MSRGMANAAPVNGHDLPVTNNEATQTPPPQSCSISSRLRKRPRAGADRDGTPPKRLKYESERLPVSTAEVQPQTHHINAPTSVKSELIPQNSEQEDPQEQSRVVNGDYRVIARIPLSPGTTNTDRYGDGKNGNTITVSQSMSSQRVPSDEITSAAETNQPTLDVDISTSDVKFANTLPGGIELQNQIIEASAHPKEPDGAAIEVAQSGINFFRDPTSYLIKQTLPILDHLADQILTCFSECTLDQLVILSDKTDSIHCKSWSSLGLLFSQARKVCQMDSRDLNTADLGLDEKYYQRILRKVNVVTTISAMISPLDYDLLDLDKRFLGLFLPLRSHVAEWPGRVLEIFHKFKTQAYIALLRTGDMSRQELADQLFPADMKSHHMASNSSGVEKESTETVVAFLEQCNASREYFRAEVSVDTMETNYDRKEFLLSISDLVKNDIRIMFEPTSTTGVKFDHVTSQQIARCAWSDEYDDEDQLDQDERLRQEDMANRAAQTAHNALNGRGTLDENINSSGSCTFPNGLEIPYAKYPPHAEERSLQAVVSSAPVPNTSTREQYEKARIAATARAAVKNKGALGTNQSRRPWSTEEEDALLTGLDRVKGPHWSQILAMFGTDGTVSEVLKDRNQVQLKDKARNLKLFFLKNKQNVPLYLEKVTGELRTRAPSRAAKLEVKERLEEPGSEDKAATQATSILAKGFTAANSPQVNDKPVRSGTIKLITQPLAAAMYTAPDKQDLEPQPEQPEQLQKVLYKQRKPETEAEIEQVIRTALDEADDQRNQPA